MKYSITKGQYNALVKQSPTRSCKKCGQMVPKYIGRYPQKCTGCGGDYALIESAISEIVNGKIVDAVVDDITNLEPTVE